MTKSKDLKTFVLSEEVTYEDYLNNSGTRASKPIYRTKKTRFSKSRLVDGCWVREGSKKIIIIDL